jgi:FkbM family methyltransferase
MELYDQDAELRLLSTLIAQLECRSLVEVGAERGQLAHEILLAGIDELHAFDPHPDNVRELHVRFDADPRVTVHQCALGDSDGHSELRVARNPDGMQRAHADTLVGSPDTDEIVRSDTITVTRRSLGSLIDAGEISAHTGILKIDTEGHGLAVVRGMGALEADVVMVRCPKDQPDEVDVSRWTVNEMVAQLQPRGFNHVAFIVHRGEFVAVKWGNGNPGPGAKVSLVFLHERKLDRTLPELLDLAGSLAEHTIRVGEAYMRAWNDRLALVEKLRRVADERLALVRELKQAVDDQRALVGELQRAADDRLALIDELERVANDRLALIEELGESQESAREPAKPRDATKGPAS